MKRALFITLMLLSLVTVIHADHNTHLYETANALYEEGEYAQAIAKYEEILSGGYASWEVYYNLGNAFYKNAELGKSILNYERALAMAPKNEDVKYNLALANLTVVDKINAPEPFFLFKIVSDFKNYFSLNVLSIIVLALYCGLITLIILTIILRGQNIRKTATLLITLFSITFVIFGSTLLFRIKDHHSLKYAIMLAQKVEVTGSPEESGTELFSLHEGVKVQIEKEVDEWYQIRLEDGKTGWVKKTVLGII
ncbi:MAG: tetratricopeptide repeat protein [candidate division KSB1 bacterium]|nr:tetratricopeptide repeat protein [candidate division KSB1 bacterium]